jgi:hypothetical protein
MKNTATEIQNINAQPTSVPINIQEKLSPNKNVKIEVDGKSYKVMWTDGKATAW